ncbi:MafI family immunity protein [Dickeya dianthicola]|nr:MafI family immunity protein [Dickeya dianthicola]
MENNYLSVSEKSELEIAKQKLRNSTDPAEREQAEKDVARLTELDISRDGAVLVACGNGAAGSAACAAARLEAYQAKAEYENTGNYNSRASQQYGDAYGQIVNLLNITSVDAQNQQQVKDAMVNYAMKQLGVDKATAEQYISTYDGMRVVAASVAPVLGAGVVGKLNSLMAESSISQINQKYVDILSPEAKQHILYGDGPTSGGHLYPGNPGKTVFPQSWSADKVVHEIGDIATSPNTTWYAQTGTGGQYTSKGDPAKWVAYEERDGVRIRVVYQPAIGKIITAFPDNTRCHHINRQNNRGILGMFAERIISFGRKLNGKLDQGLLDGALDYIKFNEEPLALEILCDHICEYDINVSQAEYDEVIELAKDMGFDINDAPYKHMKDLVI